MYIKKSILKELNEETVSYINNVEVKNHIGRSTVGLTSMRHHLQHKKTVSINLLNKDGVFLETVDIKVVKSLIKKSKSPKYNSQMEQVRHMLGDSNYVRHYEEDGEICVVTIEGEIRRQIILY